MQADIATPEPAPNTGANHGSAGWLRSRAAAILVLIAIGIASIALLACSPSGRAAPVDVAPHVAAVGPVPGETYDWKPVAVGGGGFIVGQASDARGRTHIIRADVYGAYLWQPTLDRWVQLVNAGAMPAPDRVQDGMNEGVYEVAVAPSDANRIYLVSKGRVYRSEDRGAHFVRAWPDAPLIHADPNGPYRFYGPFMVVAPDDPNLVLLGTPEQGLWRSEDGGRTWTAISSVPPATDLKPDRKGIQAPGIVLWFEPRTGHVLAMSAGNGVFVSRDRGRTFAPLDSGPGPRPLTLQHGAFAADGRFFATDPETRQVWVRDAHGWTAIGAQVSNKPRTFGGIAIDPAGGTIWVFDNKGLIFRSTDNGQSWNQLARRVTVEPNDPPWIGISDSRFFGVSSALFDPAAPHRLWVGSGTGIFYAESSPDSSGLTFTSRSRGIEELVSNDMIQPPGGAALFAFWDFGIHRKVDLDAYSTGWEPQQRSLIAAQEVAFSASHPEAIVTNASDTRLGCCAEDGRSVMAGYSRDGGASWERFPTLPHPPGTQPDDPRAMAFGTIAVSSDDPDNVLWEPAFNRSPFFTRDNGRTWQRVELPGEVLPFTGSYGFYAFSRRTVVADPVVPHRFYYYHAGDGANRALRGLWRSEDGGEHWARVFTGEVVPASAFSAKLRAVPGRAGHLFMTASVINDGDTKLRRSTDGGVTWQVLPQIDRVDDVAFGKAAKGADYPAIYLSGRVNGAYGIWRSIDDARTWHRLIDFPMGRLDQVVVVGADPDHFGRVYVGYKGSAFVYGQPDACRPAPFTRDTERQCRAIE